MKVIYHYTTANYARDIILSGYLKVSEWERRNIKERPALWLSLNNKWERTANKALLDPNTGLRRRLSFAQQSRLVGCVRFVLPFVPENLCSWKNYGLESNTSKRMIKAMEHVGKEQGGNPNEWYASFSDISLEEVLTVEIWNGKNWIPWNGQFIENFTTYDGVSNDQACLN